MTTIPGCWKRIQMVLALAVWTIGFTAVCGAAAPEGPKVSNPKSATPASGAKPAVESAAKSNVGESERLSFDQTKVVGQMNELEERMFRLADALKALEPENSSRLRLALKFAREELIQQQMKEVQQLLATVKLDDATIEQKQLVTKLQRLQELLLSTDLDFQMRLERLRLIREILRRLDTAIKEEQHKQKDSTEAAKHQDELTRLNKRRKGVEQLIADQTRHLDKAKSLAKASPAAAEPALTAGQESTRRDTGVLRKEAADPSGPSKNLEAAEKSMEGAVGALKKAEPKGAVPHQESALANLKKELQSIAEKQQALQRKVAEDRFAAMKREQLGNRQLTENATESTRKLGDSGASAANELIRASGKMSAAENDLGAARAASAGGEQTRALEALRYARNQLADEMEKLLGDLHGEVRKRVTEALVLMKEQQTAVRETTQTLQPKVKQQARLALASVVALGKTEGKIVDVGKEILTLVEETEFSVALPPALRIVLRAMTDIQGRLGEGDASPAVVDAERQVEADLEALLNAMKQMPSSRVPRDGKARKGQRDREKELNRLVAELKMIRLLQVRVNGETVGVDGRRAAEKIEALSAAVRNAIKDVEQRQDEVRDTTERLSEARGDGLNQ